MAYNKPQDVLSPKKQIKSVKVIHDDGEGSWSMAELEWIHHDQNGVWTDTCLGFRWNGWGDKPLGNPQSRGQSTWFLLPGEMPEHIFNRLRQYYAYQKGR